MDPVTGLILFIFMVVLIGMIGAVNLGSRASEIVITAGIVLGLFILLELITP